MRSTPDIRILAGLPLHHRARAAALIWAAFGGSIAPGVGLRAGHALVRRSLRRERVLAAVDGSGALLGVVGLRGPGGGLLDPGRALARPIANPLWLRLGRAVVRLRDGRPGTTADLVLDALVTDPARHRQGVARALIRAAAAQAARAGHPALRAEVAPSNRAALRLYASLGFVETPRRRARPRILRLPV